MNNVKTFVEKYRIKLESIFEELHLEYIFTNLNDSDLNYFINIKPSDFFSELQALDVFKVFVYLSPESKSFNLLCSNVYKISSDESLMRVLNCINEANSKISYGKFYADDKGSYVLYSNRTDFPTGALSSEVIKKNICEFIVSMITFFELANTTKEEENVSR